MRLLGHMVVLFLVFKWILVLFSIVAISIYIPPTEQEGSLFSTSSPAFIDCRFFDDGNSDQCEVISLGSFDLHFSSMQSQKLQNDLCSFPRQTFNITVIQAYAPTSNSEEAEAERFYEDLQDLLELTPQKNVLFIIGDWNAKVGCERKRPPQIPLISQNFRARRNKTWGRLYIGRMLYCSWRILSSHMIPLTAQFQGKTNAKQGL